jgi:hypothetical protein
MTTVYMRGNDLKQSKRPPGVVFYNEIVYGGKKEGKTSMQEYRKIS